MSGDWRNSSSTVPTTLAKRAQAQRRPARHVREAARGKEGGVRARSSGRFPDSAAPISGCGSITGTRSKRRLNRLCMHILNFSAAYTIYTAPTTPDKHRQTRKQQVMSSPAARGITCYSKIPEFLVGNIGQPMPAVGLGTASHPFVAEDVRTAVLTALELGYRHIDTAALYASERVVGEAMAEAVRRGVVMSREELFVTSKVWCTQCHPELVLPSLKESLMNLQMEYVDLYLIHWPMAVKPSKPHFPMKREDIVPMDLSGVWQAMEECHRLGLAKMIGVSNFTTKKLQELLAIAKIPPVVNQVELNPTWQQKKLIEFCNGKGIHVSAYSPLGGQRISKMNPVRQSDILEEIGKARGKSVAQISLRWIYEQGASMVVKSLKRERLKENIEIFDWELNDEDRFKIGQIAQHKLITVHNLLCPEGISSVNISDVDVLEI